MKIALTVLVCAAQQFAVVDGDTLACGRDRVRLIGLDAPELTKAKCPGEFYAASAAQDRLGEIIASAGWILVPKLTSRRQPAKGKYGRALAWLITGTGQDAAQIMIAEGHARAYDGRSKRKGWC